MSENSKKVAQVLLEIGAVKLSVKNPFQYASGRVGPIYCDNRLILSNVPARETILEIMADQAKSFETDHPYEVVAGVATAGIPHGSFLAYLLTKPMIYIRSSPKGHGLKKLIEGELTPGANVLVVEDLVNSGKSSLKAIKTIAEQGGNPVGLQCIVNYQLSGVEEMFGKENCPIISATDFDSIVAVAASSGRVEAGEVLLLKDWHANPENWNAS
ncbi:MAG: orotate phosphoribosyltransferase [Bacteriovoracaceae bacterium]|jgi:orotate phosphoribosyltransferase|nr:orotate phosphoribosyltransferase [Bacteriovoracaceae bacterium]